MLEEELTIAVLSQTESLLGYLNPDLVQISETNELYELKTVTITHPLFDDHHTTIDYYDSLLTEGNKIWRPSTCDGEPCLYIIDGEKDYNHTENTITIYAEEAALELGQLPPYRDAAFSWTVNSTFITTYFSELFESGTLTGPGITTATAYTGCLTPLAILRKIEEKTGGEFQFRYEKDGTHIRRYIDYLTTIGETHTEIIELGYNALELGLKINEAEVRTAAAPIGEPSNDTDEFHKNHKAFEDLVVSTGVQIPLYVTQDDNGNDVNGPMAYPPYSKGAGDTYVACTVPSEIVANYAYVHQQSISGTGTYPRVYPFDSSETNAYNLYWECVDNIREHLEPEINMSCKVLDLKKLAGITNEYFKTGDTVNIRLPVYGMVSTRITKTTKNPRELNNDTIDLGNYQTNFLTELIGGRYKSAGMVDLTP